MSKRVRTLLRVSSRQQLHDDDIPMQRAEVMQFIKQQNDWVFDREYMEKAVSAYKNSVEDRAVLQEILTDARARQFEILLTYMSDRIGRQEEYSFYVAALNRLGIEVWTIRDGQLKTQEHVDKLLNYIRFWQNEGESKKTSARVRDTQKELIKAGKFLGGKAPFGYRLVPSGQISNHGRLLKKPEIVEEKAEIVRRIYGLAVYRGMGSLKIANTLNEEGVPAITTDKWKAGTIADILKNPIYMGYPCINRRVNHGSFIRLDRKEWVYAEEQVAELVIVEEGLWEKAQQLREARKTKSRGVPFSTKGSLALIGLAYCGYCGRKLKNGSYSRHWTVKATGEQRVTFTGRYLCPGKCEKRSCYSQAYLEDAVFSVAEDCIAKCKTMDLVMELEKRDNARFKQQEKAVQQLEKERKRLEQDIKTLEDKIPSAIRGEFCFSGEKLAAIIGEKTESLIKLDKELALFQIEIQENKRKQKEKREKIAGEIDWKKIFRRADVQTKQMLLAAMMERIEVKDGEILIKCRVKF